MPWGIPATFVRHQIGAILATVADFGTMSALVQLLRVHPVAATGVGAAVGGVTNFLLGRHWVFGAASHDARVQALKYALVSAGSLGANMLGEHALHDLLGLHYVLARVITALSVAVLWNYPLQRSFVFRVRELHSHHEAGH